MGIVRFLSRGERMRNYINELPNEVRRGVYIKKRGYKYLTLFDSHKNKTYRVGIERAWVDQFWNIGE